MGIFSVFSKSNTLYFPGCIAYFRDKDSFELWKKIFYKLGIDFKLAEKKVCCGLPALEAGYDSLARKLARRNFDIFKEEKIDKILTPCPVCYKMFKEDYKRFLPEWNIEALNVWKIILDKLEEKPGLIKNKVNEEEGKLINKVNEDGETGFQDSCYLGRYSGIYEEPREIVKLIGYKIKEIKDNRENCFCSGSCGSLPITNPELANKTAREKLLQFKRAGIKKLIVCSPEEYELLKKNSTETKIEILEFSEILGNALGLIQKQDEGDSK